MKKKIMMLGGLRYLLPVIKAAHESGYHVITCDYLPDNVAHRFSDEYHNISIVDKEAVLALARELRIDGIMSFAVDPGVLTAAYVSEKMGLPGSPYESVKILQHKDLFRQFLTDHGFNVPASGGYSDRREALEAATNYRWPVIVKPVDSAGSKGVTRIDRIEELPAAIDTALANSISKRFIIEEFIEKQGCSSDSDCFSVDGKLKFVSFSDQRFDAGAANPYTPSAYSWPSTIGERQQQELTGELQRLLGLLHMGTSIYNIETRVGTNGKPYIMEVSPRGGGNRLSEMLRHATGVDLIKNAVRAAAGDEPQDLAMPRYDGYWAEIILHADRSGVFEKLDLAPSIVPYVRETDLWVTKGRRVDAFHGANDAIGTLVLRFDTQEQLAESLSRPETWLKINLKQES